MSISLRRVADLAEQVRGVTYAKEEASSTYRNGYVAVLRAGNITETGLVFDNLVFVPAARVSEKQMIRLNDVVLAASSGSLDVVGKAAPVVTDFRGSFGAFCKVLRPNSRVVPAYFAHFFKTPTYRQRVSALAAGVNINNLRNEHLDEIHIPVPDLGAQRRIADVLDRAEALRAKRRAALVQSETLIQAIFLASFGDPATNPMKWPQAVLGDVIVDGPQNGLYRPASEYGSGIPIVRIDAFYDGKLHDVDALKRVRISDQLRELYALRPGDILVNRVNSMEYLGKSAVIPEIRETTVFESNMMRFSADPARIEPGFLIQFLQSAFIKAQIRRAAKHAVNQSSINQQDVTSFRIFVPPLRAQQDFARRVAAVENLKSAHRASLAELDGLFASLQHRAFRGEL